MPLGLSSFGSLLSHCDQGPRSVAASSTLSLGAMLGAFSSVLLGKQDARWPFLWTSHLWGFFPAFFPQQSHCSAFWFFPPSSAIPISFFF